MPPVPLYNDRTISISHDLHNGWLVACWKHKQTKKSIMKGCRLIVEFMIETKCYYILNDNTEVVESWNHSIDYVSDVYFPELARHGLKAMGGVTSPDVFARFSAHTAVKRLPLEIEEKVRLFDNSHKAKEWLRSMKAQ